MYYIVIAKPHTSLNWQYFDGICFHGFSHEAYRFYNRARAEEIAERERKQYPSECGTIEVEARS